MTNYVLFSFYVKWAVCRDYSDDWDDNEKVGLGALGVIWLIASAFLGRYIVKETGWQMLYLQIGTPIALFGGWYGIKALVNGAFKLAGFSWLKTVGLWRGLKNRIAGWWKKRQETDEKVLKRSSKRAEELCKILPGPDWADKRECIKQIAKENLPSLLARRAELDEQLGRVDEIISNYSNKTLGNFAFDLLTKTTRDRTELQKMRDDVQKQIDDALAFLDHVESDLYIAKQRGTKSLDSAKLQERFRLFSQSVGSHTDEIRHFEDKVAKEVGEDPQLTRAVQSLANKTLTNRG